MNLLQLYVNDERVELFPDENISMTSSIQNIKDISKIFTDFSQSFTVPATSQNNKIFKHYYNYNIVGGFDARVRQKALLQINHIKFREGKISLMGVDMKDNAPSSYRIVFYGSTVTLPDLFGDDVLPDLEYLSEYDHDYNETFVRQGLETSLINGNVIYPLITHTKRLYYDSNGQTDEDGNLSYDVAKPNRGLNYIDLKPALKLRSILSSIEKQYNLNFSSTFFNSDMFGDLFMWLHRKKGGMTIADGVTFKDTIKNWDITQSWSTTTGLTDNDLITYYTNFESGVTYYAYVNLLVTPKSDKTYTLYIYDSGLKIATYENLSGKQSIDLVSTQVDRFHFLRFDIETSSGLTNYDAKVTIYQEAINTGNGNILRSGTTIFEAKNQSLLSRIIIRDQIPNMGVLDFMTNLFKMFNLTAFVKQDGSIYVETLDYYYDNPPNEPHDLTPYVFTDKSTIDRSLPYKKINLNFSEPKTFLVNQRNQILGGKFDYGNLIYDGGNKFDGTDYNLELKFEKILYERLTDAFNNQRTNISYGWFTEYNGNTGLDISSPNPTIGEALIFFNSPTNTGIKPISWINEGHIELYNYNRPTNSKSTLRVLTDIESQNAFAANELYIPTLGLTFGSEVDDYYTNYNNTSSLFEKYYKRYIENVFNPKGRIIKVKAKLPNKFILRYQLNDIIIINGSHFYINSIQTDLLSGISDLELINKLF